MQNVRFPNRLVGFIEAIVFVLRGLFVADRSRNTRWHRPPADWSKLLNDCVHSLPKMFLWPEKEITFSVEGRHND